MTNYVSMYVFIYLSIDIIHLCQRFSNPQNTSETRFLVLPTAPVSIFFISSVVASRDDCYSRTLMIVVERRQHLLSDVHVTLFLFKI